MLGCEGEDWQCRNLLEVMVGPDETSAISRHIDNEPTPKETLVGLGLLQVTESRISVVDVQTDSVHYEKKLENLLVEYQPFSIAHLEIILGDSEDVIP